MEKGINTFNYVRQEAGRAFQDIVPEATADNIQTLGNILMDSAYQPQLNQFVNVLINRVALTIVRNKSYSNPLAILKKGSTPLGTDIQDIYENPAEAKPYEYSDSAMAQLLKITDPDTHVAYYRVNRRDKYTKTITREGLQGAFVSWDKFEQFISSITQSLYSGNYIDEFKYTKDLVDAAYDNGKVIVKQVSAVTNESTAKAFLKECRKLYNAMSFPSSEYNAYTKFASEGAKPITTWTEKDRVVLLIKADVLAEIDVEALASAFNLDKADFMGRVIPVDKFENEEILGLICDEAFFQIYDNIFRFDEFYNANTMAWNEYLHAWNTFAICPFANAVVLATALPKPATAISVADVSIDMKDATTATATVTVTPNDATTELTFASSDEEVFTVTQVTNTTATVTAVAVGKAEIYVYSDNGLSAKADVVITDTTE